LTRSGLLLVLTLIAASGSHGQTASAVVCPNGWQTGNYANCVQAPVLLFGNQGTSTTSGALTVSVNNCSSSPLPTWAASGQICMGTGTLVLGTPFYSVSGDSSSDFAVTGGTCRDGGVLDPGSYCTVTLTFQPDRKGDKNANLIIYSNASNGNQTLTLAGKGISGYKTLSTSSCPTALTGNTNYQLSANIVCDGTVFTISGSGVDLNLNGYTITYLNSDANPSQANAIQNIGYNTGLTVHNGEISQGSGTKCKPSAFFHGCGPVDQIGTYAWGNVAISNVMFNFSVPSSKAVALLQQGNPTAIVHDITINNSAAGVCASIGCRNTLQSTNIVQSPMNSKVHFYNICINGGPQGGIAVYGKEALVEHNLINPGNVNGTNTNNFGIYCWGSCVAHDNIIGSPLQAWSTTRGIQISDAAHTRFVGRRIFDNYIGAFQLPNNLEYGGCQSGGAYGIQFDDDPMDSNSASRNVVVGTATNCGAAALKVTDSKSIGNESKNNVYKAVKTPDASPCIPREWSEVRPGCAYAVSLNGPSGFSSYDDTFQGDSGIVYLSEAGATNTTFYRSKFSAGSAFPSETFYTFTAANGPDSPVSIDINDATFGTGTAPVGSMKIDARGPNQGAVSIYINWTQTFCVVDETTSQPITGAAVTVTDSLANAYSSTTDASGCSSIVVTQYRLNNDHGANEVENRNPYSRTVSYSGCDASTAEGLNYASPGKVEVILHGCHGHETSAR